MGIPGWLTLAPHGGPAHGIDAVVEAACREWPGADAARMQACVREGLTQWVHAIHRAFPANIYADFDFPVASLVAAARNEDNAFAYVRARFADLCALQDAFGRHAPLKFRYVHDLLYGFDWARWVARAPHERASMEPFGPIFLAYMRARGEELVRVIASGESGKYPPLSGDRMRNPFGFRRHAKAEKAILQACRDRGGLPIAAWDAHTTPRVDVLVQRDDVAAELGLAFTAR